MSKNKKYCEVVQATKGVFDTTGLCWTDRVFSHPQRTIRVASSFSGIGAPEKALERLGLNTKIVFACDIGERYLKYTYKQLREFIADFNDDEKEAFAQSLFEDNKPAVDDRRKKGIDFIPFTIDEVKQNLFVEIEDTKLKLELTKGCLDLLIIHKGLTTKEEICGYIDSLYDKKGKNYVKESFFANHTISEDAWYTDIRFLDATKYKGQVDLYVGGSPCCSYSRSGKRLALEDTRGTLFYDFAKRIEECEPKVFIFENVIGILDEKDGNMSGLEAALEVFQGMGYKVCWQILDAQNCGVPQHRERVWVVGVRNDIDREITFPAPIPLTEKKVDYLENGGYADIICERYQSGAECLKLMGFTDFKVAPLLKDMGELKRERTLCQQAGNSMVVECLMAMFKQIDITQFGVDLGKEVETYEPISSEIGTDTFKLKFLDSMFGENPEPTETLKVKILDEMNFTGRTPKNI